MCRRQTVAGLAGPTFSPIPKARLFFCNPGVAAQEAANAHSREPLSRPSSHDEQVDHRRSSLQGFFRSWENKSWNPYRSRFGPATRPPEARGADADIQTLASHKSDRRKPRGRFHAQTGSQREWRVCDARGASDLRVRSQVCYAQALHGPTLDDLTDRRRRAVSQKSALYSVLVQRALTRLGLVSMLALASCDDASNPPTERPSSPPPPPAPVEPVEGVPSAAAPKPHAEPSVVEPSVAAPPEAEAEPEAPPEPELTKTDAWPFVEWDHARFLRMSGVSSAGSAAISRSSSARPLRAPLSIGSRRAHRGVCLLPHVNSPQSEANIIETRRFKGRLDPVERSSRSDVAIVGRLRVDAQAVDDRLLRRPNLDML